MNLRNFCFALSSSSVGTHIPRQRGFCIRETLNSQRGKTERPSFPREMPPPKELAPKWCLPATFARKLHDQTARVQSNRLTPSRTRQLLASYTWWGNDLYAFSPNTHSNVPTNACEHITVCVFLKELDFPIDSPSRVLLGALYVISGRKDRLLGMDMYRIFSFDMK